MKAVIENQLKPQYRPLRRTSLARIFLSKDQILNRNEWTSSEVILRQRGRLKKQQRSRSGCLSIGTMAAVTGKMSTAIFTRKKTT